MNTTAACGMIPVEHCCEHVNSRPVLLSQYLPVEPSQEEVDDNVVEPGVVLQGLVVFEGDRHTGALTRWELAQEVFLLDPGVAYARANKGVILEHVHISSKRFG